MKVLVLGIGKMGYGLLKDLNAQPDVEEIVAADINKSQALKIANRIDENKISVEKIDVTDMQATVSLMRKGFDVVASALPRPFCDAAAASAIEAGVGYTDVAAGFSTIFKLDKAAKEAGVTIVPHIGLDIGIDRVLCGVGARKLDSIESFYVWCGGFPQKGTAGYENPIKYKISWYWPYAVNTNLRNSTILKDGKTLVIQNLSDPEEIVFPEPIGKTEAFTTGGLMDVVKHLGLKGVKNAVAKTVRWPGHCETWTKLKQLRILDKEDINIGGRLIKPYDLFIELGNKYLQYDQNEGDAICQRVEVIGEKNGKPTTFIYEFIDFHDFNNDISAMARTTAFPCSIIAQMIAKNELKVEGIIHPAKIGYNKVISDRFFKELSERKINITEYIKTQFQK